MDCLPWNQWRQFAFGILHWTPDAFWSCSFQDFYQAYEGWRIANGVEETTNPMTRAELEELMEKFPDK